MTQINVIAFGGLGGSVFSAGLKTILMRLNGIKEIDFKTYEDYGSWRRWGQTLQSWRDPTVLMGHSFGVAAMFGAARAMGTKGPDIPLAISFDPSQWWGWQMGLWGSGGNVAPDRVKEVINFYQHGLPIGYQKVFRPNGTVRGISNKLIENVAHANIEDLPSTQAETLAAIKRVIATLNPPTAQAA